MKHLKVAIFPNHISSGNVLAGVVQIRMNRLGINSEITLIKSSEQLDSIDFSEYSLAFFEQDFLRTRSTETLLALDLENRFPNIIKVAYSDFREMEDITDTAIKLIVARESNIDSDGETENLA